MRMRSLVKDCRGVLALEMIGLAFLLTVAGVASMQVFVGMWSAAKAASAARTGGRVASLDGDGAAGARAALPTSLRNDARIVAAGTVVRVTVRVPKVFPVFGDVRVSSRAEYARQGGGR